MYDNAVYIGRFQPFHSGHLASVQFGLSIAKNVIIALGGFHLASSPTDPWTTLERKKMILKSLTSDERKRVKFVFIRDRLYDESLWKENLSTEIRLLTPSKAKMVIIGHDKDESSYYLKIFPQWKFIDTGNFSDINGTRVRHEYFQNIISDENIVPKPVAHFLKVFQKRSIFTILQNEYFRYNMNKTNQTKEMLVEFPEEPRILLQFGNYILLKKYKRQNGSSLYELPLCKEIKCLDEYQHSFVRQYDFYCEKYDSTHTEGRKVRYYKISQEENFPIKKFKNLEYQWMIFDDLVLNEEKMFADYYQILHSFLF